MRNETDSTELEKRLISLLLREPQYRKRFNEFVKLLASNPSNDSLKTKFGQLVGLAMTCMFKFNNSNQAEQLNIAAFDPNSVFINVLEEQLRKEGIIGADEQLPLTFEDRDEAVEKYNEIYTRLIEVSLLNHLVESEQILLFDKYNGLEETSSEKAEKLRQTLYGHLRSFFHDQVKQNDYFVDLDFCFEIRKGDILSDVLSRRAQQFELLNSSTEGWATSGQLSEGEHSAPRSLSPSSDSCQSLATGGISSDDELTPKATDKDTTNTKWRTINPISSIFSSPQNPTTAKQKDSDNANNSVSEIRARFGKGS